MIPLNVTELLHSWHSQGKHSGSKKLSRTDSCADCRPVRCFGYRCVIYSDMIRRDRSPGEGAK
jgi:hypothetical protein